MTPDLVGEDYLSWFEVGVANQHIAYSKNSVTMTSLREYVIEKLNSESAIFYGIFIKNTNKHIGNIKFEPVDFIKKYAVMGVLIGDPEWRGLGVFAEVFNSVRRYLLEAGLEKIFLGVDYDNLSAIQAYEKSGFVIDKENTIKSDLVKSFSMLKIL